MQKCKHIHTKKRSKVCNENTHHYAKEKLTRVDKKKKKEDGDEKVFFISGKESVS